MANRNAQHIYSPTFSELSYRVLNNLTKEQREVLNIDELKIFQSEYTLQKFCKEERIDRVGYFLAKIGYSWTIQFERNEDDAERLISNADSQYDYPEKRVDITERTKELGVVVISSREVMNLAHMTAQNCLTGVYAISQFSKDMQAKGKDIKQLTAWDNEIKGIQEAHDIVNNLLLEQLNSIDYIEEIMGMDMDDLRILSALYKKRNSALRMRDFPELTKAKGKKMYMKANMEKLLNLDYISCDRRPKGSKWMYEGWFMISTKGIGKVMEYRKLIFKNAFGA